MLRVHGGTLQEEAVENRALLNRQIASMDVRYRVPEATDVLIVSMCLGIVVMRRYSLSVNNVGTAAHRSKLTSCRWCCCRC
jgi:hypothetical protein